MELHVKVQITWNIQTEENDHGYKYMYYNKSRENAKIYK